MPIRCVHPRTDGSFDVAFLTKDLVQTSEGPMDASALSKWLSGHIAPTANLCGSKGDWEVVIQDVGRVSLALLPHNMSLPAKPPRDATNFTCVFKVAKHAIARKKALFDPDDNMMPLDKVIKAKEKKMRATQPQHWTIGFITSLLQDATVLPKLLEVRSVEGYERRLSCTFSHPRGSRITVELNRSCIMCHPSYRMIVSACKDLDAVPPVDDDAD